MIGKIGVGFLVLAGGFLIVHGIVALDGGSGEARIGGIAELVTGLFLVFVAVATVLAVRAMESV